jgi:hypothetical protein
MDTQDRVVEHLLREQLLEPGILLLEGLQSAGVRNVHPAILALELVERGR